MSATRPALAKPVRVLMVSPQPFFELRGTPLNVLQMLKTLCRAGYEVHLATYPLGKPVDVPGLTIHRARRPPGITHVPIGFSRRKMALDASLALTVWRLLLTQRFDVVHAVEESVFFTLPMARMRGIPVIYDMDSSLSHQLQYSGVIRSAPMLGIVRRMEAAALRRASLAITVCRDLTERVRAVESGTPIAQIEDCPLEESLRDPDPGMMAALRSSLGVEGHPVAVYTGNLEPYQGIDLLVDGLPALVERCPNARIVIVGGEAAHIQSYGLRVAATGLSQHVVFAGPQPAALMAEYMGMGDALLSPRRIGGNTPLKLYSYMNSGVPIVATDLDTHRQVLDETTAVLAPAEGPALGRAIADVLSNPAAYAERGAAARERVRTEYSAEMFERKLLAAYGSLLGALDIPSPTRSTVASSM